MGRDTKGVSLDQIKVTNQATAELLSFARDHISQCLLDLEFALMPNEIDVEDAIRRTVYAATSMTIARDRMADIANELASGYSADEEDYLLKETQLWIAEVEASYAQNSRVVNRIMETTEKPGSRAS